MSWVSRIGWISFQIPRGYIGWDYVRCYTPRKTNIQVALIILNPRLPIAPCLIRLRASQSTDLGRVIYANSITFTPGTITLDVRDDIILVHNLTQEMADDLLTNEMDRRVTRLERDT